jgi:hypothetical protein
MIIDGILDQKWVNIETYKFGKLLRRNN